MVLATNENIIKCWNYGSITTGKGIGSETSGCMLTVTNKRIINEVESRGKKVVDEYALNSVKGVSMAFSSQIKWSLIVFALLFIAAAVVLAVIDLSVPVAVVIILAAIGVLLLIFALIFKKRSIKIILSVEIYNVVPLASMSAFNRAKAGRVEIKVSKDAKNILEGLGAIIAEYGAQYK